MPHRVSTFISLGTDHSGAAWQPNVPGEHTAVSAQPSLPYHPDIWSFGTDHRASLAKRYDYSAFHRTLAQHQQFDMTATERLAVFFRPSNAHGTATYPTAQSRRSSSAYRVTLMDPKIRRRWQDRHGSFSSLERLLVHSQ